MIHLEKYISNFERKEIDVMQLLYISKVVLDKMSITTTSS